LVRIGAKSVCYYVTIVLIITVSENVSVVQMTRVDSMDSCAVVQTVKEWCSDFEQFMQHKKTSNP